MVDDKRGRLPSEIPGHPRRLSKPPDTGDVNMGNKAWRSWQHTPMDWWQCQLNFAVWCATAGCGVSADDHLQAKDPPPCESVSLPCLLCDEASACGAESRPSWRPISFLVSECLRRQGLQAALHQVRSFA